MVSTNVEWDTEEIQEVVIAFPHDIYGTATASAGLRLLPLSLPLIVMRAQSLQLR
jgi:hypothetical protein